jgi:hypothetical protein
VSANIGFSAGEHAVGDGRIAELLERDEPPVGVVGEDVGGLHRLAIEMDRREDHDLLAVGDEVVRLEQSAGRGDIFESYS